MTRPIAHPIAGTAIAFSPRDDGRSPANSAGKVSAPASPVYVTARRVNRIAAELTERDTALLTFVATSRLATSRQLVRRFWTDDPDANPSVARAGRRALKRLTNWRVIDPLPGRARGGLGGGSGAHVYVVGVAGAKLLARRGLRLRRLGRPGDRFVRHVLACTDVVVDLGVADECGELELIEIQQEPVSHRAFLGAFGTRQWVKPDLFVRVGVGALEDRWFIEVDLATEHRGTLLAKAKRYREHFQSGDEQRVSDIYPRVLWAVPDAARAREVQAVLRADGPGMFSVCLLADVAGYLAGEARA